MAVLEPCTYDRLFDSAVAANDEGHIPIRHVLFEAHTLNRLHQLGQLSPAPQPP